jgi:hypothetical protein
MGHKEQPMARFNDTNVPAAVQPHLQSGEVLRHYAFGVKPPPLIVSILIGPLFAALITKNYIVALTNRRLLVLRFKGRLKVIEATEYPLDARPAVSGSVGMLFTKLRIDDTAKPFFAKFHRMGMPNNRMHSSAILEALTATA